MELFDVTKYQLPSEDIVQWEKTYNWYWIKNTATAFTLAKKQPMRSVETISVFSKGTPSYYPQGLEKIKTPEKQIRKFSEGTVYESKSLSGKEYVLEFTGYPNNVLRFDKEYFSSNTKASKIA